ncbi:subtilisin-like protein [Irpex rosettiformis]|uniref:Subtilisin-like protein n=1 Tax=Irpex rosettiformis TaxID=378272 RepID=A0ACB8UGG3_9APHY|nr:subtilisin-like protein [Irpex rosettiformis]
MAILTRTTLAVVTLATSCLGSLPFVKHESRLSAPPNWEQSHRAPAETELPLRIGLAQPNIDRIGDLLLDISHPQSKNYGNHWSAAQVSETFRPSVEALDGVRKWLVDEGIAHSRIRLSNSGGWLEASVSVAEAEQLLKTEYYVYNHTLEDVQHVRCALGYHIPEHLAEHIDFITPTIHFNSAASQVRSNLKRRRTAAAMLVRQAGLPRSADVDNIENIASGIEHCDTHITPDCLRALYNFSFAPQATEKNSFGIVEYTPQAYVASDLDMFFDKFSKPQVGERPTFVSIDGGFLQTNMTGEDYNGESALDLQYAMALVGEGQPVTLYQVDDGDQSANGTSFNDFLDALDGTYCAVHRNDSSDNDGHDCGTVTPTWIISTSYYFSEQQLTDAYKTRQCAEYAKLGLMGVTVLYSTGDNGVASGGNMCLFQNGTESSSPEAKRFSPTFPSTCPFITGVGATQIVAGNKVSDPESAIYEGIFTAGGFSNFFAVPDYQKTAVQNFLTNHPPQYSPDIWNSTGHSRAYPDIALNGANYVIAVNGKFDRVFGTSASAPALGAMLYAINDARLAVGKKPIGFINPAIYSPAFQDAFNDITNGTNPGCGTEGFSAVEGWDPVSGVGTPNYPKLLQKWLELP